MVSLHESYLRPLHTCESSSSRSTYSTPRHQFYSSYRSKDPSRKQASDNSFEPMERFHDGPIFDQDENEKNDHRNTFERIFIPLGDSYDMVLKTLAAKNIITLPNSIPYEPEIKPP